MKRILTILAVIVLTTVSASAQDSNYREKASHFYATAEFNLTGGDYQGWGKPDFGSYGFTVSPGYRFNPHWAVFVPVNADVLLLNRQSTKNFVEQGTLGLGGSYITCRFRRSSPSRKRNVQAMKCGTKRLPCRTVAK